MEIINSMFRYIVTPVQSIVPPSQGEWANPAVPKHPFNPGNVGDVYPAQHTTFGIMAAAGYTYVGTGYGDLTAHWEKNDVPLPTWKLLGPSYEISPNFFITVKQSVTNGTGVASTSFTYQWARSNSQNGCTMTTTLTCS